MRVVFFVLLTGLLAACTNSNSIPAGIIPSQKMATILWQLMQSDEYVNTQLVKDSLKKPRTEKMKVYQEVFDLNGTSLVEFKKSYQYYMEHPDITKIMFDSITARAARQRTDIYKQKTVVTPADSLKPAHPLVNTKPDTLKHGPATLNLTADRFRPGKFNLKPDTVKPRHKKAKKKPALKTGKKP